jgi:hypothetical protein
MDAVDGEETDARDGAGQVDGWHAGLVEAANELEDGVTFAKGLAVARGAGDDVLGPVGAAGGVFRGSGGGFTST